MQVDELAFASSGLLQPCVVRAPVAGIPRDREARVLCAPVLRREGGFLLALPSGSVPPNLLKAGNEAEEHMAAYDPVAEGPVVFFDPVHRERFPEVNQLLALARSWLRSVAALQTALLSTRQKENQRCQRRTPSRRSLRLCRGQAGHDPRG